MSLYDIADHICKNAGQPAVLATLIGVEGHSYRKPGAVMLFFEEGTIGSLSPGCLESDLQLRTKEVWESGRPETVEYDMLYADDFSWGEAVGCGGKIRVVLEPVKGELRSLLTEASGRMSSGECLMLRRRRSVPGYSYWLEADGENRQPEPFDEFSFSTLLVPKPRLILFGAGNDGRPIAELAARTGFRIAAADWREAGPGNGFPAEERILCSPGEAPGRLGIGNGDYVLICSHQAQRDRQFLERVLAHRPRYIGIIGSRARISLLLEGLEAPESLHAPVGLPIGGEGPEEIAVSIVAELIQIRRAGSRQQPKGGDRVEDSRNLFGGRAEQPDGGIQSFPEAVGERYARERRAQ